MQFNELGISRHSSIFKKPIKTNKNKEREEIYIQPVNRDREATLNPKDRNSVGCRVQILNRGSTVIP